MHIKIKDLPINDRPRERLINFGADNLSNDELLAVLLKTGNRFESAKSLASDILAIFGNVNKFREIHFEDLIKIRGVGIAKACTLMAAIELGHRINREVISLNNLKMTSAKMVYNYYHDILSLKQQEYFYCLYLDTNKRIIKDKLLFIGTLNQSLIHPREIYKEAYKLSASGVVCVHNHPSGNVMPSKEDIKVTNDLMRVGKILGIELIDHIIVGNNNYYSFFENNDI